MDLKAEKNVCDSRLENDCGEQWEGRALTFFVTPTQRKNVLCVLRRLDAKREAALMKLIDSVGADAAAEQDGD